MKKYIIVAIAATFALISCDKKSDAIDAEVSRQKANGKITYVDNVNVEIAQAVAEGIYTDIKGNLSSVQILSIDSMIDWNGKTAIYVFNFSPKGFVLTSADIRNEPIIGYSKDGTFNANTDEMPEGLLYLLTETMIVNYWLQDTSDNYETQYIISSNANQWANEIQTFPTDKFVMNWHKWIIFPWNPCVNEPRTRVDTYENTYGYYCQTQWNQGAPYNYYCPHKYPVGCVAVALGQIMRFYEHPNRNWSAMPNTTSRSYDYMTSGDHTLAHFLREAGNNVNMDYGADGSGATDWMAAWALEYKYDYDKDLYKGNWNYSKIKNDIVSGKPVYVSGWANVKHPWYILGIPVHSDGHAYVIDGVQNLVRTYKYMCEGVEKTYKTNNELMHYNFGYNGSGDGWFSRSIIDDPAYNSDPDRYFFDRDAIRNETFRNFQYYGHF
ncbi:MAG: C10 family peptidase [Prevotellaceae bacterium]|jgi:hypothetical protein|nr:C10 family peptidase [Prevotellaceae bacterium]